jgi:hypothetical protein
LNAPADDWAAFDRASSDFAASGGVEVREDGQWRAELATLQCEINRKGKQPRAALPFRDRHSLKYLSPEIQVTRIGPSENWRRGIKIIFPQ